MTDFAGGADAPAAPSGAPISNDSAPTTQPLGSQTPVAEKPPAPPEVKPEPKADKPAETPSKSAGDALRKASEAAKAKAADTAKEKPADPPQKPAEKAPEAKSDGPSRAQDGKFAPREAQQPDAQAPQERTQAQQPTPSRDAPARFDDAAKADWEKAPDSIKGAVQRTIRELEQGHQKYKADAESYDRVREFDQVARQNGGDLRTSLERVKAIEDAFTRNPIEGFNQVAQHFGLSLRDVAAHIMGQTPDQVQRQQDSTISQLQHKIDQLTQQVTGVTGTLQTQQHQSVMSELESFAQEHPRLNDEGFANDVLFFLNSDKVPANLSRTERLSEAYELANRLNPDASNRAPLIPASSHARAQTPEQPRLVNPAGQKSISGGPSAGSDPESKLSPSTNNREALRKAFARAG